MSEPFSSEAKEGLRQVAQSVEKCSRASLLCPKCGIELHVQFMGRLGKWTARHPTYTKCEWTLANWGKEESEEALRTAYAAGQLAPRISNPQTRSLVTGWIDRIRIINDRRKDDHTQQRTRK